MTPPEGLGQADAVMGSGVSYYQYYVRGGLLTFGFGGPTLTQPGMDERVSLEEWVRRRAAEETK